MKELYFYCFTCGKEYSIPRDYKDCPKCKIEFIKGKRFTKCNINNCENPIFSSNHPLCIQHYRELQYKNNRKLIAWKNNWR